MQSPGGGGPPDHRPCNPIQCKNACFFKKLARARVVVVVGGVIMQERGKKEKKMGKIWF